jgi:hypothetical protein
MIIQSAYKALEIDKKNTVDQHCNWAYLSLKIGDDIYRMIFELNKAYSLRLLRQWMINDNVETNVGHKYFEGKNVTFDCSNGLCGVRDFEFCIGYEFCLKPMGIPLSDIKDRKYNWALNGDELMDILRKNNIEFEIILDSVY